MGYDILRIHVDESLTTIKQVFADRSVSRAQVAYCYMVVGNQLLAQHINKRDSGAFLTTFPSIPLEISKTDKQGIAKNRKYFTLPGIIFDFDKDDGIDYMSYVSDGGLGCPPRFTVVPFNRTSQRESYWLYMHPDTMPSPSNPYYYRTKNIIHVLGLEKTPINEVEVGAYMTIDPLHEINLDSEFAFPMELMAVLKRQVIDLIRYNWFFPSERKNEGTDSTADKSVNVPKTISVNDPSVQQ